jgi:hypothetical protein
MRTIVYTRARRHAFAGVSTIELAIILPILLMLVLGVIDFGRAILFNNILINMSREGANLASRTTQDRPGIILVLNFTSSPLAMKDHGMVYISRVKGVAGGNGTVIPILQTQFRPKTTDGDMTLGSKLWTCPSWQASGECNVPNNPNSRAVTLPVPIAPGDVVDIVESMYEYLPFTNYVVHTPILLYSSTVL